MKNTTTTKQEFYKEIDELAKIATFGTLKRIYSGGATKETKNGTTTNKGSADNKIRKLRYQLNQDFSTLDNNLDNNITDAYDCYLVAFEYLWQQIVVNQLNKDSEITIILKNGTEKTRTIQQWASSKVRQYIYSNKSLETNNKFYYLEDITKTDNEGNKELDKEYIKVNKYYDLPTIEDLNTYNDLVSSLNLTDRQKTILHYRMQGLSINDIADKLNVRHNTVSTQLIRIQDKIKMLKPEMLRQFKI